MKFILTPEHVWSLPQPKSFYSYQKTFWANLGENKRISLKLVEVFIFLIKKMQISILFFSLGPK